MKKVGAHVSSSGGVRNAPLNAEKIGAKAFALFVKNQRQWFAKSPSEEDISLFNSHLERIGIEKKHILPHGSYLLNLGSPSDESVEKSMKSLSLELNICKSLGIPYLNIHPGSHLGKISEEESLDKVANCINKIDKEIPDVMIVIENTAGQGNNIGHTFEHLNRIISGVKNKDNIGVCLDTCHMFAAGYDLRDQDSCKRTFDEFGEKVGFNYLVGMHLNDSKTELGSKKDKHHSLGQGFIGLEPFKYIMNQDYFDDIPLILETIDSDIWKEEIEMLYSFIK